MQREIPVMSFEEAMARVAATPCPPHAQGYAAMYSSEWDAVVTDPRLMRVPVDDHLVHRGDGVFETVLFAGGRVYLQEAHLTRLQRSAGRIGLALPWSSETLGGILSRVFAVAGKAEALARILVGRGPGGFAVDPEESIAPSLYIVVYPAGRAFMRRHPEGARAIWSQIPPKPGMLATVKTCNYLPNAMMKAEATAAGAHFAIGVDEDGYVTESFTENVAGVDADGTMVVPPAARHLPGTTLKRVMDLAGEAGIRVVQRKVRTETLLAMTEVLVIGTTARVTSVTCLDGHAFPLGPVGRHLGMLLDADIG